MLYGILINGVLKYAPKDYITTDQVVIENFNKNEKLLLDYGYKTVIDEKPNYNKDTQYLTLKCYTEFREGCKKIFRKRSRWGIKNMMKQIRLPAGLR